MKYIIKNRFLQICAALFLSGIPGMMQGAADGNVSYSILVDNPLSGLDAGRAGGALSGGKDDGVRGYEECDREADILMRQLDGGEQNDTLCYSLYCRFMDMLQYDKAAGVATRALAFTPLQGEWKYMKAMTMLKMGENAEAMRLMKESLKDCESSAQKSSDIARTSFLLNLKCLLGMKGEALADLRDNLRGPAAERLPHAQIVEFAIKDFNRQRAVRDFMKSFLYANDDKCGNAVCASGTYKECLDRISSLGSAAENGTLSESDMWKLLKAYTATYRMDEAKALAAKGEERFSDNGDWTAARAMIDYRCGGSQDAVSALVREAADKYRAGMDKDFDPLLCLKYIKALCSVTPKSDPEKELQKFGNEFMAYEQKDDAMYCITYSVVGSRLDTSFYDDWARTLFPGFVV